MTSFDAIPANQTLSTAALKEEKQPIAISERLTWKGRHVDLKPKYCQRNAVRKAISVILLGLGFALAGCAVLAALTFVALPGTVIGVTATLAALGGTFFISGLTISLLSRSWNDPTTRIRMGKQAADKISKNNLNYAQIRRQYGTQIDHYQILNNADLNLLLRKDLSRENLPYETLITRHGKGLLKILDEKNHEVVRQKFLAFLTPPTSLKTVLNSYSEDVKALQITAQEISVLLETYIKTLDYEAFKRKNGIEFLATDWIYTPEDSAPSKLLNKEARDTLKTKFLDFLKTQDISLADAKRTFANDITLLKATEEDLIIELTNRDLPKLEHGTIGYLTFKKNHGFGGLEIQPGEKQSIARQAFLSMPYSDMNAVECHSDRVYFGISNQDIFDSVKRDLYSHSYDAFKLKHGLAWVENPLCTPEDKVTASSKLIRELQKRPYSEIRLFLNDFKQLTTSTDQLAQLMEKEFNTSFEKIIQKHGKEWLTEVPAFTTDLQLKSQLAKAALKYVNTHTTPILTNNNAHGSLLLEHHLLTQEAEDTVNNFKEQYQAKVKETEKCIEALRASNSKSIRSYKKYLGGLAKEKTAQEQSLKNVEATYYRARSDIQEQSLNIENCKTNLNHARQRLLTLQRVVYAPGHLMGLRTELETLVRQRNLAATTPVRGLREAMRAQNRIRELEQQIHHIETLPHQLAAEQASITRLTQQISILEQELPRLKQSETQAYLNFNQHRLELEQITHRISRDEEETRQSMLRIGREESDAESAARIELREAAKTLANELKGSLKKLK